MPQDSSASAGQGKKTDEAKEQGKIPSAGQGQGHGQGSGQGSGQGQVRQAELEMLRSAQLALNDEIEALKKEVESLNPKANSEEAKAVSQAKQHLDKALKAMGKLDKTLAQAYFKAGDPEELANEGLESYETTREELDKVAKAIETLIERSDSERTQKLLQAQAEAMAELAENADDLGDDALQAKIQEVIATGHSGGASSVDSFKGSGTPPQYIVLVDSIVPPADKSGIDEFIDTEPRRAARWLAEEYFLLAIKANQERGALRQPQENDARFSKYENEFFERAAEFEGRAQ